MATKTTKTAKASFTPDQLKVLSSIFHRVWDYIGSDCLNATQECEGRNWMKRDEVIEVCLDAGRPEEEARTPEEKELLKQFGALPYDVQQKIARKMFSYARYGF